MSRARGAALLLGAAMWGSILAPAVASTMGSLAPRSPDGQQKQQWLVDPRTNCMAIDSDFDPGDSISWRGDCVAGIISGPGTLTFLSSGHTVETITGTFDSGLLQPGHVLAVWADGSKYDGGQAGGQFDGVGVFTSSTGDRVDGEWKAGALNGRASVVWANGDRYDGSWKDGASYGQGLEIWANGDRYDGLWQNGKPVGQISRAESGAPAIDNTARAAQATGPATQPVRSAATLSPTSDQDSASPALPFQPFMGTTLVAVDGSTVSLNPTEAGFSRLISLPNGNAQQTSFAFMNDRIGTVSNEMTAIGLFRETADGLDVNYTDGSTETTKAAGGGLLVMLHGADGSLSCTAWYPQGHLFSQAEKKAAVQEYASRLGVASAAPSTKHHSVHSAPLCGGAWHPTVHAGAASAENAKASISARSPAVGLTLQPAPQKQLAPLTTTANGLESVPVRPSVVHLIDAPNDSGANQAHAEQTILTGDDISAYQPPLQADRSTDSMPSANASACLTVASNGEYWGFQNRCNKAVQFAYCEVSDSNPLTSCHRTSVAGSVAANGFSALVGDRSLSEQGVRHDFRWMACDGGAGEVVPHLDSVDPPVGRCERVVPPPD